MLRKRTVRAEMDSCLLCAVSANLLLMLDRSGLPDSIELSPSSVPAQAVRCAYFLLDEVRGSSQGQPVAQSCWSHFYALDRCGDRTGLVPGKGDGDDPQAMSKDSRSRP